MVCEKSFNYGSNSDTCKSNIGLHTKLTSCYCCYYYQTRESGEKSMGVLSWVVWDWMELP